MHTHGSDRDEYRVLVGSPSTQFLFNPSNFGALSRSSGFYDKLFNVLNSYISLTNMNVMKCKLSV
jgi:hypothetical protein